MDRAREDLLVLAAQDGDRQAFAHLFRAYHAPLARFAFRLCGDEQLAIDAVQESWISLSRTLRTLDDPRAFRLWAYKTVRWRTIDLLRRQGARTEPLSDDLPIEETMEQQIATGDQVNRFMKGLPRAEKVALTLFYLHEMTLAEIASVEGVPVGTVKSRLNRARERLRGQMTGDEI